MAKKEFSPFQRPSPAKSQAWQRESLRMVSEATVWGTLPAHIMYKKLLSNRKARQRTFFCRKKEKGAKRKTEMKSGLKILLLAV